MRFHERAMLPEEQKADTRMAVAKDRLRLGARLDVLEAAIAGSDFLVGEHFTAADLSMASILHLAHHLELIADQPRLVKHVQLHCARPACRRAVS